MLPALPSNSPTRQVVQTNQRTPPVLSPIRSKQSPSKINGTDTAIHRRCRTLLSGAEILISQGNFRKARDLIDIAANQSSEELKALKMRAKENFKAKAFKLAKKDYETILNKFGIGATSFNNLIWIYNFQKNYLQTIETGTKILEHDPNNYKVLQMRGIAYAELGQRDAALKDLTSVYENTKSKDYYLIKQLVELWMQDDEGLKNALLYAKQLRELFPENVEAIILLATIYRFLKKFRAALELYKLASQNDYRIDINKYYGIIYLESEQYEKAVIAFNKYLSRQTDFGILSSRAQAYYNLQDFKNALKDITCCTENVPNRIGYIGFKGCCHMELGDLQNARLCFNKILRLDPKHALAKAQLGQIRAALNMRAPNKYLAAPQPFTQ